jgi:hypothetical protein
MKCRIWPIVRAAEPAESLGCGIVEAAEGLDAKRPTEKELLLTTQEAVIAKLRQMPEPLAQQVNDFIDFLLFKQDELSFGWFRESNGLAEAGMNEYAENLSDYEGRLERGEIEW